LIDVRDKEDIVRYAEESAAWRLRLFGMHR
jgi:hypothetical protein